MGQDQALRITGPITGQNKMDRKSISKWGNWPTTTGVGKGPKLQGRRKDRARFTGPRAQLQEYKYWSAEHFKTIIFGGDTVPVDQLHIKLNQTKLLQNRAVNPDIPGGPIMQKYN